MSESNSKQQILKSTGIVGISQILTILFQMIRTKIIAILLGPSGIGVLGIYQSIETLSRQVSGLGINVSGVRDISYAYESKDYDFYAKTALVLKRCSYVTAFIGAFLIILLCRPISIMAFGDSSYSSNIAFLSISVVFITLSQTQVAILQGSRKLISMSKATVLGVALSIVIVTPTYYFWGVDGMVFALILMSICSYIVSGYYVRKLRIPTVSLPLRATWQSSKEMIKIGVSLSFSEILTTFAIYYIRTFISTHSSITDVGYFNAGWSIAGIYISLILNAMAADYYPRLCSLKDDNKAMKLLINEQGSVALIIGLPIIVTFLTFSPLIIRTLYSQEFLQGLIIIICFVIGSYIKLFSWPLSYAVSAKGAVKKILFSGLIWNILFIVISLTLWEKCGLISIGISYIIAYLIYYIINYIQIKSLIDFHWDKKQMFLIIESITFIVITFIISYIMDSDYVYWPSIILVFISLYLSFRRLSKIISFNEILSKIKTKFSKS